MESEPRPAKFVQEKIDASAGLHRPGEDGGICQRRGVHVSDSGTRHEALSSVVELRARAVQRRSNCNTLRRHRYQSKYYLPPRMRKRENKKPLVNAWAVGTRPFALRLGRRLHARRHYNVAWRRVWPPAPLAVADRRGTCSWPGRSEWQRGKWFPHRLLAGLTLEGARWLEREPGRETG